MASLLCAIRMHLKIVVALRQDLLRNHARREDPINEAEDDRAAGGLT